jgi:predicted nuclease with RNAse H fold
LVLTVGIDLAAGFAGTAIAWVDWSRTGASVCDLVHPADDDAVVHAILNADKAGIDCPFGWPEEFVSFVNAHRTGAMLTPGLIPGLIPDGITGRAWRRRLAYRMTDEVVRDTTGLIPLSVSADRIGHTAMRCATVLALLAQQGQPVDRCGTGTVVEVYPAASLKQWALTYRGYKGRHNLASLELLVDALQRTAPWLHLGAYEQSCRVSDHALDAVIAALTARAAYLGLTTRPNRGQAMTAATEGWIVIPTSPMDKLWQRP